tara:strand:+ start:705 stop:1823 length:1119 start_codon:yes stop_codon:yes gene_type:complete
VIQFNIPTNFPTTKKYILDVVNGKTYGDFGKYYNLCLDFLESFTGAKKIILTHSATAALELAFQLLASPKSTALVPTYTFSSTANAALKNNLKVSWIDVNEDDLCSNIQAFNKSSIKNKIYVPVHYGSSSCDMTSLDFSSPVIEDAAQSLGVFHKNKHVGTFGVFGALSFHNTKFVHAGFGGAILINDTDYFDEAMEIYNRGTNRHLFQQNKVNKYNWTTVGSSFGNSELNFAVLFSQLEHLDQIISKRKIIYEKYVDNFKNLEKYGVKIQNLQNTSKSNYSSFYLLTNNMAERDELIKYLKINGIASQFHYVNLHDSPMGKKITRSKSLKISESVTTRVIRLPIYPDLKNSETNKIVDFVSKYFESKYQNT